MSSRDDRTQREKLEAMANQTASPNEAKVAKHLLFKKYGVKSQPKKPASEIDELNADLNKTWKGQGMRRAVSTTDPRMHTWYHGTPPPGFRDDESQDEHNMKQPKPHVYEAYGGMDSMGCRTCGRSKDNKSANHIT